MASTTQRGHARRDCDKIAFEIPILRTPVVGVQGPIRLYSEPIRIRQGIQRVDHCLSLRAGPSIHDALRAQQPGAQKHEWPFG